MQSKIGNLGLEMVNYYLDEENEEEEEGENEWEDMEDDQEKS